MKTQLKNRKGIIIVTTLVTLLPALIGVILWDKLPEQMPIHWNAAGEIDNYMSKGMAIFLFPLIMLAAHLICVFVTAADPENEDQSKKVMQLIPWIIPVVSMVLAAMMYPAALGHSVNVLQIACLLVGLMFLVIGNYLPKTRPNYSIGFRIPWTLHDEENWKKTHRLAGPLAIVGGFLMILEGFFQWHLAPVFLIILAAVTLVPTIYSYLLYRKKNAGG